MSFEGRGRFRRSPACVFVGNLPGDVAIRDIESIFKFGRIRDIDIKRGRSTDGTSYAFVEFETVREAEDAVEFRNGHKFLRNRLRVEFTGVRGAKRREGNIYSGPPKRTDYRVIVTNLPNGCSWQHLKDHMRKAGDVGYANIEFGRGVVEYIHQEDYQYALERLDGSEISVDYSHTAIKVRPDDRGDIRSSQFGSRNYHRRSRSNDRVHRGRHRSHSKHRYSRSRSPVNARHQDESRYYQRRPRSKHPSRDPSRASINSGNKSESLKRENAPSPAHSAYSKEEEKGAQNIYEDSVMDGKNQSEEVGCEIDNECD